MRLKSLLISLFVLLLGNTTLASHVMGGEITFECLGSGQYQFDLVIYRDCNGLEIVDPSIDIEVWNHPTVTSISCDLFNSIDLSPQCTEVPLGPPELDCGVGTSGGTGPGAVQKFIYRSAPVTLSGVPPAEGWTFTYDSFSRNWGLTNMVDPALYGLTLSATMYAVDGNNANPCTDSSPQFAQDPYMLLCAGTDFAYDPNAFDPDNDSLVYSWGTPYNDFTGTFNPPTNPAPIDFVVGFSNTNPTPDASFDASNVPASMDSETGVISFTSNTVGNYGFVQQIDSYRNGQLISTVNREIQMIVIPCPGYSNTAPTVVPPFGGGTTWEATFFAGDLINFDIVIEDLELLQDGTPQTVTLDPSGTYFGTGLTDATSGCEYAPCATLDMAPVITGVQGLTTNFNWQTSCDHLMDASGEQQAQQVYTFVLNVQDDYCSVPGRTYETIKITLLNRSPVEPVDLHCVDVLPSGDVELTWEQTTDPDASFSQYEVWSIEDGFIAAIPDITTENFSIVGASCDLGSKHYYVDAKHGCGAGNSALSDTLETMFLTLSDLADGRISLSWNNTHDPMNGGDNLMQEIWREYPVGTWTKRKEVPYGENFVLDTVDVCNAFMSYEIRVPNAFGCISTSNNPGDDLQDQINPEIPIMTYVTVDTINGEVDMAWNINPALDTYGYIINKLISGFWTPIDTVWGRTNTVYAHVASDPEQNADLQPETYRIAAFDSCETATTPGAYQTSALSPEHTTIHATVDYDICAKSNTLNWTTYVGWPEGIDRFEVWVSIQGSPYTLIATVEDAVFQYTHSGLGYDANYVYVIKAISANGTESFSNRLVQFTTRPSQPAFHYLSAASHTLANEIEVSLYTDGTASVNEYDVEVLAPYESTFDFAGTINFTGDDFYNYYDMDVFPERGPYSYRVNLIDSCGKIGEVSNIATTSYLSVSTNDVELLNTLNWTSYQGFDGDIVRYDIYRGVNGVFGSEPIASTPPEIRSYVDDVNEFFESEGQFCYRVQAVEETNSYGFSDEAFSNAVCITVEPLVYIPNAFMINGNNHIFLPVVNLYDFSSYDLKIYDRWGGDIFNTQDPNEGWDGANTVVGGYHAEGTYIYFLSFQDRDGKDYEFRGTVTLLIAER
ncbi:MAG: gliding motility-associated C-terminal domain-containing protein [Flavobacteriales bacterium]|nr:gliding motility-associated C-terminal domain-containing protein [Flavobacteriales bacterium]